MQQVLQRVVDAVGWDGTVAGEAVDLHSGTRFAPEFRRRLTVSYPPIDTSAYVAHRYPAELVTYMRGHGRRNAQGQGPGRIASTALTSWRGCAASRAPLSISPCCPARR